MSKKRIILCEPCGWKTVSDTDGINLTPLNSDTLSNKKYRCPNCGRAVTPRKCKDPQSELENKNKDEQVKRENKKWMEESIALQKAFKEETDEQDQPA